MFRFFEFPRLDKKANSDSLLEGWVANVLPVGQQLGRREHAYSKNRYLGGLEKVMIVLSANWAALKN